jgi:predicted nucleic acid-binding protein
MSLFEDAMQVAVQLPLAERERLARALGLSVHTKTPGKTLPTGTLPLNAFVSNPSKDPAQSAAWRQAETGHAVLATASPAADATGPRALFGLLSTQLAEETMTSGDAPLASSLPAGTPVVVHSDVCAQLATGNERALQFFESPGVEIRLATASYLTLLGAGESAEQLHRVQGFVQPYAVLSLGPMASSRAVELMIRRDLNTEFNALDALIAATALAHEIPLVTLDTARFANISELQGCAALLK